MRISDSTMSCPIGDFHRLTGGALQEALAWT
jgi:hypothetical protein